MGFHLTIKKIYHGTLILIFSQKYLEFYNLMSHTDVWVFALKYIDGGLETYLKVLTGSISY